MRPEKRQYILMISVIGAGLVLILLDAPPFLLIIGTVMVGFLTLLLTGAIRIGKESPGRDSSTVFVEPSRIGRVPGIVKKPGPASNAERTKTKISLKRVLALIRSLVEGRHREDRTRSDPVEKVKNIDRMLDSLAPTTSAAPASPTPGTATSSSEGVPGLGLEPLRELSTAQMEDDLLIPDPGEDLTYTKGEKDSVAHFDLDAETTVPFDANDGATGVENVLKSQEGGVPELENLGDMDVSMDSLENLDLDAENLIAPNESPPVQNPKIPSPDGIPNPGGVPVPPSNPRISSPISKTEERMTFPLENTKGDDFLAALKTDMTQVRKPIDLSLLRDLKEEKPKAEDLEKELEHISNRLNGRAPRNNSPTGQE